MKYNLQKIMLRAWRLYREKKELSFTQGMVICKGRGNQRKEN